MHLLNALYTHCHFDKYFCWQKVPEAPYHYTHAQLAQARTLSKLSEVENKGKFEVTYTQKKKKSPSKISQKTVQNLQSKKSCESVNINSKLSSNIRWQY